MFSIPAAIVESIQSVDISTLMAAINNYAPAIQVIRDTWSRETLSELIDGNVAVPDKIINKALADKLQDNPEGNIKSVELKSRGDGKLEIKADTKSIGRIEVTGTIEKFTHNQDESVMCFKVKERALKDHGLLSWFVSRISLSMAEHLMGKINISDELPTKVKGNTITVDFHDMLQDSKLAQTELNGHRLLDMIEIEDAVPKDGYIAFKTKLNIPDDVKDMFRELLTKDNGDK